MCGICGTVGFEDRALVERMLKVMKHRGPDDSGIVSGDRFTLGHTRLSIVDLETGHQPMHNEDESIWVVCNGEIYNHKELKKNRTWNHEFYTKSDTEILIHEYEGNGMNFLGNLNGMFAFALWDSVAEKLFLARDRMGIKPLYYYIGGGGIVFASEIKALLEYPEILRRVNETALNRFITFRYNPGWGTMIRNVYKLTPGHYATIEWKGNLRWSSDSYWSIESFWFLTQQHTKLLGLLKSSVRLRLMSDVPLGVYLSGGIDSSSIVAIMNDVGMDDIKTFTINFAEDRNQDAKYARQVAEFFNTDHTEINVNYEIASLLPYVIYHADDPLADPALIPIYLMSKEAKKDVSVVLTGAGGDEIFGGYPHYPFLLNRNVMEKIPNFIFKAARPFADTYLKSFGDKGIERLIKFAKHSRNKEEAYLNMVSIFDEHERKELFPADAYHSWLQIKLDSGYAKYFSDEKAYYNQVLRLEAENFLVDNVLMGLDKMSMAYGLEARVPLLDHRIVLKAFYDIPPRMKHNKLVFRKAMREILPRKICNRKKQGFFVPIDTWLESDLSYMIDEYLSKDVIEKRGFFDYYAIQKMLRNYQNSKLYYARQLWSLINFEIWHRLYIDEMPLSRLA